jgi:tetratricopeptide (TPR) repeat protein
MKRNFACLTVALLVAAWTSACTQNPPRVSANDKPGIQFRMPSANANALPPDVLATCRRSVTETRAGHLDAAIQFTNECLAYPSLPVSARSAVLHQLAALEIVAKHDRAALDAEVASVQLSAKPDDVQLMTLAHLYRINSQYADSVATLDRLREQHKSTADIDRALGMAYYEERGWSLLKLGRDKEAVDSFTRGIPLQPALAEAYLGRAKALEASGDSVGARSDYTQFARWAVESAIDSATHLKLNSLGIDPARERLRPFGKANPLRDLQAQNLAIAQISLRSAKTPQEKADAYHSISMYLDGVEKSPEALSAIDKALALVPGSADYAQSKCVTLDSLNRLDDALALGKPLLQKAEGEAAAASTPDSVYERYGEVSSCLTYVYTQRRDWGNAINAMAAVAKASIQPDKDYMSTLYLYIQAKSSGSAPDNKFFDDYIRSNSVPLRGNYRRGLLLYWQGLLSIDAVYAQIVMLDNTAAIENALSETWFSAAAYERYVKHDEASARAYIARLNALQPYGTTEWMLVKRDAL